ncbi:hypothetical protein C8Q72DRAFT_546817 [Fomitopsis betulina]|nr:hypothetical protein C8Q72DRAFT_546817 [Fomitopsis betulina]
MGIGHRFAITTLASICRVVPCPQFGTCIPVRLVIIAVMYTPCHCVPTATFLVVLRTQSTGVVSWESPPNRPVIVDGDDGVVHPIKTVRKGSSCRLVDDTKDDYSSSLMGKYQLNLMIGLMTASSDSLPSFKKCPSEFQDATRLRGCTTGNVSSRKS